MSDSSTVRSATQQTEPTATPGAQKTSPHLIPGFDRARFPLVALGLFALLAALWGGLIRQGWGFPPIAPVLTDIHGPLMVSGFLGTLISLERAAALRVRWAYTGAVSTALGTLVLVTGLSPVGGALLMTLGSTGMIAIFVAIVRRQPALFTFTMALGAVMWFLGNLIWLVGLPIFRVVLWWSGFLILTIVGERLELSRLLRLSRSSERLYGLAVAVFSLGAVLDSVEGIGFPERGTTYGLRIAGAGLVALALWLWRHDIARRTVHQSGLTRFIAVCLLAGYFWLAVGGILRLVHPDVTSSYLYDATLHSVFLGFVMSMIFGHAPIILPAVLGRAMAYQPGFYAHLILLHLSLALRIIGDLGAGLNFWQWGGLLNVVAVLLFLFATARAIRMGAATPVRSRSYP